MSGICAGMIRREDLRDVMHRRIPKRRMPVEVKDAHRAVRLRCPDFLRHRQHAPERIRGRSGVRHRVTRFGGKERSACDYEDDSKTLLP